MKTINDSRVTLDPEGNLYFSNITTNDASDQGFYYVCAATSVHRNEFKLGNKVFIRVTSSHVSSMQNRYPPELQYVSRRNEIAYRGKTLELYCIFGGTYVFSLFSLFSLFYFMFKSINLYFEGCK